MLGFSSGTKDGGYLKQKFMHCKKDFVKVSENDVKVFSLMVEIECQLVVVVKRTSSTQVRKTIANNKIELTIQGQTITSVLEIKDQAKYNFEQLLTAGIENEVLKIIKRH